MTRLLYLPDDATVIQLEVKITPSQLCEAVNAGMRPLPLLRNAPPGPLIASEMGETVIVVPASAIHPKAKPHQSCAALSRRQAQVHDLASRGLSSGEIAVMLHLSRRTVNYHLNLAKNRMRLEPQSTTKTQPLHFQFADEN